MKPLEGLTSWFKLVKSRHHCVFGLPVLLLLPEVEGAGAGGLLGSAWASGAGAGADNSTAPKSCKTAWQVCVLSGHLPRRAMAAIQDASVSQDPEAKDRVQ